MGADHPRARADLAVLERGVRPDHGVLADHGGAEQLDAGQERDVGGEHHVGVDPGGRGVHHGDALDHPAGDDPLVHHPPGPRQLHPVVDALGLLHVVDLVRAHVQPGLARELDGVGEVVLALGVVVGQPRQRVDEERRVEGEDPRVDLPDRPLLVGGVLLLDDRLDLAVVVAHHPAVAERVGHDPAEDADRPLRRLVLGREGPQRRGLAAAACRRRPPAPCRSGRPPAATTASIATRTACPVPCCSSCTASSASGASSWMCGPTWSRWWPTTATIRRGCTCCDRGQDVADHAPPGHRVQHLHGLGLHPGAATGGQHDDGQLSRHVLTIWRGAASPSGSRRGPLAPRVGVEPTSLVLIQSQAGPAGRPTGD